MSVVLASSSFWKAANTAKICNVLFMLDYSDLNKHCCPFKCFIQWYNFLVLIVCQDLFLIAFPIVVFSNKTVFVFCFFCFFCVCSALLLISLHFWNHEHNKDCCCCWCWNNKCGHCREMAIHCKWKFKCKSYIQFFNIIIQM